MDEFKEWWDECYCYTSCSKVDAEFIWNSAIEAAENAVDASNHSDCDNGMSEWQPIETAPKDGTEILLYGENQQTGRKLMSVGHYFEDAEMFPLNGGLWVAHFYDDQVSSLDFLAQKWHALPAPPTDEGN